MTRRLPLWTTLLPLAAGLAIYWWYWDQQHDAFRVELERTLGREDFRVSGFPYRLEAELDRVSLRRQADDWFVQLSAGGALVNRQPWRQELTILRMQRPRVQLAVTPVAGARLDVEGDASQTSLRWASGHVARLSTDVVNSRIWFALLPAPAAASRFEFHFRETPATLDPASRAPTYPQQAQLVLAGEAFRFGNGDPLTLAAEAVLTARAPVRDLATWRLGGTMEFRHLALGDETGEVLSMSATLSPDKDGKPRVVGTVDTVCPATLAAAFAGRPAPAAEYRARKPLRMAFQGTPGDFRLATPAQGFERVPVRRRAPPCPVLRR